VAGGDQHREHVVALLDVGGPSALGDLAPLPGFLLIQRRPELALIGATALGLSVAAYFVLLGSIFSHGWFEVHTSVGILLLLAVVAGQASMLLAFGRDEGTLAVLYLLSVLLPPCLRWEETEAS
jgi:hypothetical protein